MLDPASVRQAYETHRADASRLPRWEEELGIARYLSTVAETNSFLIRFAPELGAVERLFPAELGPPYTRDPKGYQLTDGRNVLIQGGVIRVAMSSKNGKAAPWDGGVQDAVLRTVATVLLPFVVSVEKSRWTASPFEESDPPPQKGPPARELILQATRGGHAAGAGGAQEGRTRDEN
jgi:hypothetical protein